ncbi:CBS domain-containing protein [Candidatus Woesearchaeota archaeon]|nr:CBS domain-containing protein [Candidatus Woesearchaeota archaeon]
MEKVIRIMSKKVKTVSKNKDIISAAKIMFKDNVSAVVVVEKNRPIGLLTERDLAVRVLDKNKDLKRLKVSDIMTTPILTVAPDADIYYSSEMMRKNRIKKLPVVRNGILIGIVTQTDILEYFRNLRKKFVLKNLNQKERKSYPIV